MIDIISLVLGFCIGVVIIALAIEFTSKKTNQTEPSSKHTKKWSISEISNPKIMAEYLSDIDIPSNSKILVNKYKDESKLVGLDAKKHTGIRGNFIVGDDRALILAGPLRNDEVAFWTVEKEIVESLNKEFEDWWNKASKIDYKEN